MVKTYEIDLDDKLVNDASEIFETLGSDIDSAIKIFLTQAILRKGFPFEVAVPQSAETETEKENLLEENAIASIPKISAEPDAYKIETLKKDIEELKSESQDSESQDSKSQVSEHSDAENPEIAENVLETAISVSSESNASQSPKNIPETASSTSAENIPSSSENKIAKTNEMENNVSEVPVAENQSSETKDENSDSEDEDETAPENLFSQWDNK